MTAARSELTLHLKVQYGRLVVIMTNPSRQRLKLWEWSNSWGWYSLAVQVMLTADSQLEFTHKLREWTKNGPDYFVLESHESHEVAIDLHDGSWEIAGADPTAAAQPSWRNRPVRLRAQLQVPRTPESDRLGVFTGTAFSEWITSDPPHHWLRD